MIKEYNFDEFDPVSKSQWVDKVNQDLGEDLAKKVMAWTGERDFQLAAYYEPTDVKHKWEIPAPLHTPWKFLQPLNAQSDNEQVLEALMNGADGLVLAPASNKAIGKMLAGVAPEHCTLALEANTIDDYKEVLDWYNEQLDSGTSDFLLFHKSNQGSLSKGVDLSFDQQVVDLGLGLGHRTIQLDGGMIKERGGSTQLELAYLLSQSVYRINNLLDAGIDIDDIGGSLFVSTAVGSNFFLELTKIRAIRWLIHKIMKTYGAKNGNLPIHVTTSFLTKSVLDSNTNFLRCTSEAMSAVLGGADYLTIVPNHDLNSADRIARNISNLLKEESYLAKTIDPSAGSYYVENLTDQLIQGTWGLFQKIEKDGGFSSATDSGFFESEAEKDWDFQQTRIAAGKRKVVGVNDFGNLDEKLMVDDFSSDFQSYARDFEEIRRSLETFVEEHGEEQRPTVYLADVGSDAKMINARFTFVTNFFSWSGVAIQKLKTAETLNANAVIVCCGADSDYTEEEIKRGLGDHKEGKIILAAGKQKPGLEDTISEWLNIKTNRLKGVQSVLSQIGVTTNQTIS